MKITWRICKMAHPVYLTLIIVSVTLAAPHPRDDIDGQVFGGDDIFEDDDVDDTDNGTPKMEKCEIKPKEQFIIDLRTSRGTSNDCNKTAKCSDYLDQGFSCVPFWQCKNIDSNVISDGDGEINLIDLREDDEDGSENQAECVVKQGTLDASDRKCSGENEVCCGDPNREARICRPKEDTDGGPNTSQLPESLHPLPPLPSTFSQCGRTGTKTRITQLMDPNAAQPGEFPHMCIIYKEQNGNRVYVGGASLIDKNKVISVAHKFYLKHGPNNSVDERENVENLLVRCGEYNVKTETELLDYQETTVAALQIHPLYNPEHPFLPNNLVILETKQNFIYQDHIGPVCLPKPEDDFESAQCLSSGWGKDQFGSVGYYSDILKKVDMGIVSREKCEADLIEAIKKKTKKNTTSFRVDKSHLCVGGEEGKDTCTGDGGSPHSCLISGKWIQVGTVAWGISCGEKQPAIYSSIPAAMCWIHHVMLCVPPAEQNINGLLEFTEEERENWRNGIDLREEGECDPLLSGLLTSCQIYYPNYDYDIRTEDDGRNE